MHLTRLNSNRPRKESDFYPTPIELARVALEKFPENEKPLFILDPGAGDGIWGKVCKDVFSDHLLYGVDIRELSHPCQYDIWVNKDYLDYDFPLKFNLVIGNPPYSLAEEFIRKSFELLTPDGYIYFLLRLEFLASKKRYLGLFKDFKPNKIIVCSRRPSFFTTKSGGHTTDAIDYCMILWHNGWKGETTLDWLYFDYEEKK